MMKHVVACEEQLKLLTVQTATLEPLFLTFSGISFDQGKTLPTPETIPFRLTQDIVAGFGCSGVEGIFRR